MWGRSTAPPGSTSTPVTQMSCNLVPYSWMGNVTWAKNMISSSRDSLNWSGVSSKTASVDLEKCGAACYSCFFSKNIKFSNFVFRSHPLIFLYSLEVTELLLKFLFIRLCIPLDQVLIKDRRALELRASWERVCQISTCS